MPGWVWAVAAVAALTLVYIVWTYNRLVGLRKRADGAWSDIDVQLKRRWDLIPGLVSTVKGYAQHERETIEAAVEARTKAQAASTVGQRGASELDVRQSVDRLMAVAEAYPELRANTNFLDLQKTLVDVEDHIQYARRYYNAVVRDYNTLAEQFPATFVAGAAGFLPREYFQLDDERQREAPTVQMGAGDRA